MAYWLDDGFDAWPEVVRAGCAAAGLYVRCGSWIARNTQDGHVPAEVAAMYGSPEWVAKLVAVGLWRTEGAGYRDVRYFEMGNPTAEKVKARRQADADRKARWREKRDKSRRDKTRDSERTHGVTDGGNPRSPALPPQRGKGQAPAQAPGRERLPQIKTTTRHSPPIGQTRTSSPNGTPNSTDSPKKASGYAKHRPTPRIEAQQQHAPPSPPAVNRRRTAPRRDPCRHHQPTTTRSTREPAHPHLSRRLRRPGPVPPVRLQALLAATPRPPTDTDPRHQRPQPRSPRRGNARRPRLVPRRRHTTRERGVVTGCQDPPRKDPT